ncbi:acyl carrier protein [Kitasatospora cineracea]|uniref:Acyl carrier protein n=1 Tax=Kitasatospora cineracea TaxID=88074 RepID=A0A3N4RH66_9ACTN|nr:phosphopantetheine-binding protein [Kitasatospora cineracea]ROR35607.1 acyl carrier protein [Kitasatospora cineracea]RPE27697.1 acyl carrier protein [Kitasatospora cineracea]
MDQVTERIAAVLTGKFDVPADLITARASFQDLDLDSLSVVELYVTLQEEWGVPLDAEAATGDVTVGELADEVRTLLDGRRPGDD